MLQRDKDQGASGKPDRAASPADLSPASGSSQSGIPSAGHTPGIPDDWLHEGEWARVGPFFIYPRGPDFYIGVRSGPSDFRDTEDGIAFTNIEAAIDQARWMDDERRSAIAKALGQ